MTFLTIAGILIAGYALGFNTSAILSANKVDDTINEIKKHYDITLKKSSSE